MDDKKKISDNDSFAEIQQLTTAFSVFNAAYRALPSLQRMFPGFNPDKFSELKEQTEIILIPDRFNECFASRGWIAYESMKLEVMKQAISVCDTRGIEAAEQFLTDSYDEDALKWGIRWFNRDPDFRKRIRLAELAKLDYLAERYHACIPLLLSLLDGLVNDVSKHVGFFSQNADMTAWDCIAAHESGLQSLSELMTQPRKRTNSDPISIPYRHGILHGRELQFDNKTVAAKAWAAVFAACDWAVALADGKKKQAGPKKIPTLKELFKQVTENQRTKRLIDEWRPRASVSLTHLPHKGDPKDLGEETAERAVAEFMENWVKGRFGLLSDALWWITEKTEGKKVAEVKELFGHNKPKSYQVTRVEDQAAAASQVTVNAVFNTKNGDVEKEIAVRALYQSAEGRPLCRQEGGGKWEIVQNSFSSILYSPELD